MKNTRNPEILNECLECIHATYNDCELAVARLTDKPFHFRCNHPKVQQGRHITPKKMAKWHNNCENFIHE